MKRHHYTQEDIQFLREYYPIGDWDSIFDRFPNATKSSIYCFCYRHNIIANKNNYHKNSASNFNSNKWNDDEDEILKNNYSIIPIDEILKLLPNRSYNAVVTRAMRLNLISYTKLQDLYSEDDKEYIKAHWETLSDYQLANILGRSQRSIKWLRGALGLYRQPRNRTLAYDDIYKYLRGNIYEWKLKSMEQCNYKCILTGSKDFAIHHLYNFTNIVNTFLELNNIQVKDNFKDYTNQELENLAIQFNLFHNTYPLGVCVSKDLHKKFHHIYGKYNNTLEQWDEFVENFKKGKYSN